MRDYEQERQRREEEEARMRQQTTEILATVHGLATGTHQLVIQSGPAVGMAFVRIERRG